MSPAAKVVLGLRVFAALALAFMVATVIYGMRPYEREVCAHIGQSSAVVERLGKPTSCKSLFLESGQIEDASTFVFDVVGPKGKGRVYVQSTSTGENGDEEFQGILLVVGDQEILVEGARPPVPIKGSRALPPPTSSSTGPPPASQPPTVGASTVSTGMVEEPNRLPRITAAPLGARQAKGIERPLGAHSASAAPPRPKPVNRNPCGCVPNDLNCSIECRSRQRPASPAWRPDAADVGF